MNEFDKLIKMLDDAEIPYERDDDEILGIKRIKYPQNGLFVGGLACKCSVIFGNGTYGYEKGLLEIMGLLTDDELEYDSVVGYLTAKDVFDRISKHYKEVSKND